MKIKAEKHHAQVRFRVDRRRHGDAPEGRVFAPPVDIYESDERFVVLADVPGAGSEDVEVSVVDNEVAVSARGAEEPQGEPIRLEYRAGSWHRHFSAEGVDLGSIEATVANGVLRLLLPKASGARARKVEIAEG